MKISMSMLAWYLRDFDIKASIVQDQMSIEGLRFLFDDSYPSNNKYVYFLQNKNVFSDLEQKDNYMLVYQESFIICSNCYYEELINKVLSAFAFFNEWEAKLMNLTYQGASAHDIFKIITDVIENPCILGNLELEVFIYSNDQDKPVDPYWAYAKDHGEVHVAAGERPYLDSQKKLIKELSSEPILVTNVYEGGAPVMMSYILDQEGTEPLGLWAVLQSSPELTEMNLQLAPIATKYLAMAKEFTDPGGTFKPIDKLLYDVLEGYELQAENQDFLTQQMPEGLFYCFVLRNNTRMDKIFQRTVLRFMRKKTFILHPIIYKDCLVALFPQKALDSFMMDVAMQTAQNTAVGISLPIMDISQLPHAYQQCLFAIEQAKLHGDGTNGIFRCSDYAFNYMMDNLKKEQSMADLLHPAIYILKKYDEETNSELLHTLVVYLALNMRIVEAAKELNIHTNTLKYRIRRVCEITGLDLNNPMGLKHLILSLWIQE